MSKRAVILAGGMGSRLRPYTVVLPKPLMPVGEYPILEVVIRQLARHGFEHVTLAVNYQAEIVRAFFGDGGKWNIRIDYSVESKPLSTIAPLKLIPDLPDDFLLMNGDVLTDLDFNEFFCEHVRNRRLFTISAKERTHVVDYGILRCDGDGQLTGFEEKPALNYLVSMGIYMVNKSVVNDVPEDCKYGFDNLMTDRLARGLPVHVRPYGGYWLDIGRVEDYMMAIDDFDKKRAQFIPDAT
jgi:NDP-sugar pyrophosphorylase family protein